MRKALILILLFPSLALAGDCGEDTDSLERTVRRIEREARADRQEQQLNEIIRNQREAQRDSRPITDAEATVIAHRLRHEISLEKSQAEQSDRK